MQCDKWALSGQNGEAYYDEIRDILFFENLYN